MWLTGARSGSKAAAATAEESDEDDVIMEREVDMAEVLRRRRQDAICDGRMIDIAADVDERRLQQCAFLFLCLNAEHAMTCILMRWAHSQAGH